MAMGVLLTIAGCSTLDRTMGYISCSVLLLVVRMSMGTAAVWLIVLSLQQRAERGANRVFESTAPVNLFSLG